MSSAGTEKWVLIVAALIVAAISVPAYPKLAAKLTARGVQLSWLQQLGLFALAVLVGLLGLLLCGLILLAVTWATDKMLQVLRHHSRGG